MRRAGVLTMLSSNSVLGKVVRWPLRLIPRRTAVRVLSGPLHGCRWVVGASSHGCWFGWYEAAEAQKFVGAIDGSMVVWDVGANVGYYTLIGARRARLVYAIEPVPGNVLMLRQHLALNSVSCVRVIEAAVGEEEGSARFDVGPSNSMGHLDCDGTSDVRLVTVDGMVARSEAEPPGLMKIDVEGDEVSVLRGAGKTLATYRPTLLLATQGRSLHEEACQFLLGCRYGIEVIEYCEASGCGSVWATPWGSS